MPVPRRGRGDVRKAALDTDTDKTIWSQASLQPLLLWVLRGEVRVAGPATCFRVRSQLSRWEGPQPGPADVQVAISAAEDLSGGTAPVIHSRTGHNR
ncbi:hypothetical protein NDU88_006860 [Pleurodeles waltl]|uniref:Uncharacterized protein n=1 Tax=Pleurodeles waltl TaxID=8319 RepID=A0AAV7TY81_PLEWA|nr:hypothetical protein NDU88_006860 [Pleurodeles waltl]